MKIAPFSTPPNPTRQINICMEEILKKLNSARQKLTVASHVLRGHTRLHGTHMPKTTKTDLEDIVLKTINETIGEIYEAIRKLGDLKK